MDERLWKLIHETSSGSETVESTLSTNQHDQTELTTTPNTKHDTPPPTKTQQGEQQHQPHVETPLAQPVHLQSTPVVITTTTTATTTATATASTSATVSVEQRERRHRIQMYEHLKHQIRMAPSRLTTWIQIIRSVTSSQLELLEHHLNHHPDRLNSSSSSRSNSNSRHHTVSTVHGAKSISRPSTQPSTQPTHFMTANKNTQDTMDEATRELMAMFPMESKGDVVRVLKRVGGRVHEAIPLLVASDNERDGY